MKIEPELLYDKIRNKWARHVVKENFERMDREITELRAEVERLKVELASLRTQPAQPWPIMPPYPYQPNPPIVTYGDKTSDPLPDRGHTICGSNDQEHQQPEGRA